MDLIFGGIILGVVGMLLVATVQAACLRINRSSAEAELAHRDRLISGLNAIIGEQRAEIKELQQRLLDVTRGNKE